MSNLNSNLTRFQNGVQQHPLLVVTTFDHNGYPIHGGGTIATGQVTVNGVEVTIRALNNARRSVTGYVTGNSVWFGPTGVTTGNGFLIPAGGTFSFNAAAAALLNAISSAAATVYWFEEIAE
jgi:hypothetical protein